MVTHCKIVWIPELTRIMILNCGIHAFTIQNQALRFWNTVKNLESGDLAEHESTRDYKIHGVE